MKSLTLCIAIVAALSAAPGLMGCNNKNDTLVSLAVTPTDQIMARGTTQQFIANGTFSNGMIVPWTQVVTWSSSDPTIATVNNTAGLNGIVTSSTNTGTTILTAFDVANNITGTTMLTVADPDSIQIIPTNPFMPVNATHQFSAIALFSHETVTQVITTFANWSIVSPGVVTITATPGVSGNGVVTAGAGPGTTDITAQDPISGVIGATTIKVLNTSMASIAVSPINPIISMSTSTQFSAIGTFQDGSTTQTLTPSVDASWAWSSSNTAVSTIDYYTGIAQAVAPGTTTITATDPISGVAGSTIFTIQ